MEERLSLAIREKVWDKICEEILEPIEDINSRAVIVQGYIAQGGPVPDSRGERVRALLRPNSSPLVPGPSSA